MQGQLIIRGNFLGAAAIAVIYTVYLLANRSLLSKPQLVAALVILNALTIVLTAFAFRYQ